MDLALYCKEALVTEKIIPEIVINKDYLKHLLIAYIQLGNLLDDVKKGAFYGKPIDSSQQDVRVQTAKNSLDRISNVYASDNTTPLALNSRIFHVVVGIATESTELVEAVYAAEFQNKPLDLINLTEEAADIDWYSAILHDQVGMERGESLRRNNAKLRTRFAGKFTDAEALNRNLTAERTELEGGSNVIGETTYTGGGEKTTS